MMNFDFVGSFFDFETFSDGKHADNRPDNFYNTYIQDYWIKGKSKDWTISATATVYVPTP